MLANSTTLIVGAGASVPLEYPTGAELRDWIIEGRGMDDDWGAEGEADQKRLNWRLRRSLIPSIDAFLAEKENEDLHSWGIKCIAGALLPCEAKKKEEPPTWLCMVFNAIRGRKDQDHQHPLKIVTFNYDLSIEYFLFHAFLASYKLSQEDARRMFDESVQIIHVYGQLGQIIELGGGRDYGGEVTKDAISLASRGLKIIGRAPEASIFDDAHKAILEAEFLGILGFGYDATNVANLRLHERLAPKYAYSTGFNMGYGMRAWMRNVKLPSITIGSSKDDVATFLHNSAFLQWANTPRKTSLDMNNAIFKHFTEDFRIPD
ncbi:MAG: hypothetical protein V7609_3183 [Verrucomicrobiota bacterium]